MLDLLNRIIDITICALVIMLPILCGIGIVAFIIVGAGHILMFITKHGVCL